MAFKGSCKASPPFMREGVIVFGSGSWVKNLINYGTFAFRLTIDLVAYRVYTMTL